MKSEIKANRRYCNVYICERMAIIGLYSCQYIYIYINTRIRVINSLRFDIYDINVSQYVCLNMHSPLWLIIISSTGTFIYLYTLSILSGELVREPLIAILTYRTWFHFLHDSTTNSPGFTRYHHQQSGCTLYVPRSTVQGLFIIII